MSTFFDLRSKAGLTIPEVSQLLGIEPARIVSYENGELVPSPREINSPRELCILRALDTSKIGGDSIMH